MIQQFQIQHLQQDFLPHQFRFSGRNNGKRRPKKERKKNDVGLVAIASANLPGDGLGDLPAALLGNGLALLNVGGNRDLEGKNQK